jgi:hypothetical protein
MKKDVAGIAESKSKLDAIADIQLQYYDSFLKLIEESAPAEQVQMLLQMQRYVYRFYAETGTDRVEKLAITLKGLLKSQDRAVAATAITTLSGFRSSAAVKKVLEEVSKGDDPVLSTLARGVQLNLLKMAPGL